MGSRRRGFMAAATAVVLVALGAGVGLGVGDALGISAEPADSMTPAAPSDAPAAAAVAPPAIAVAAAPGGIRVDVAVEALDAALAGVATDGAATLELVVDPAWAAGGGVPEAYALEGSREALRIVAAEEAGVVRGIYDLAAAVRTGTAVEAALGEVVVSRLPFRMTDLGAVGVDPDPAEWVDGTDYSHASKAFVDALMPEAPYVDEAAMAEATAQFEAFARQSLADGFTAIAFPGFVEFVTLDGAPGGPVYAEGDDHRDRAIALRDAFAPMWERADELGLDVFLRTDMLALTGPLEDALVDRIGSLDTEDERLWDVYAAGLDELYAAVPSLDGVLIRIGEAGAVYDVEGWDQYSALAVTTVPAVRAMLTRLSAQAEATGREVIFRSWSVGVGAVGELHTSAASYAEVLDGIDSPALIVSTKYTLGDFYAWLPLNDTLFSGEQRRIVEFQSRREFENFGAFPNDLGPEYQWALQRLLAENDRIEGVWVWTQDGGPWRAGPMTLHLTAGFWQLYELDTRLAVQLARDPEADVAGITQGWAREWFSDDPATVAAIGEAMALSREAITRGLYIEPYASQRVAAIGLEPPPMMWVFEWDILTGDSAVLNVISSIVGDDLDAAVADGELAVADAEAMLALVAGTDPATWRDPAMREAFVGTLEYEVDTLGLLADYREMVLQQGRWHATGDPAAHDAWAAARAAYAAAAQAHLDRYEGDVDFPALNLTAAQLGVDRADRDLPMAWAARGLLVLATAWLALGIVAAIALRRGAGWATRAVPAAARATWIAATRPWRAAEVVPVGAGRWLLLAVPAAALVLTRLVQTSCLSWTHPVIVLGAWLLFALVLLVLARRAVWPVVAAVGGVLVLRCALALAAVAVTGPGGYWYAFWTSPGQRTAYIALAFALFVWGFVAAGWALATSIGGRRATGAVLAAVGAGLAIPAAAIGLIGLETALTAWNDEMGLLPWGLSRILGITTYLEIPGDTAWFAAGFGGALLAVGLVLALVGRRRRVPTA